MMSSALLSAISLWCCSFVALSLTYLLSVFLGVGEHGGDVEHDLVLLERRVDRVGPGLVLVHVQAAPVYQGRLTRQINHGA